MIKMDGIPILYICSSLNKFYAKLKYFNTQCVYSFLVFLEHVTRAMD